MDFNMAGVGSHEWQNNFGLFYFLRLCFWPFGLYNFYDNIVFHSLFSSEVCIRNVKVRMIKYLLIKPAYEHDWLSNLCASLTSDGRVDQHVFYVHECMIQFAGQFKLHNLML